MGTEENSTQPSYKFNKLVNCLLFYILSSSPLLCSFFLSLHYSIQYSTTNDSDHYWMNCIHKHHHMSTVERNYFEEEELRTAIVFMSRGAWEAGSLASREELHQHFYCILFWCSMTKNKNINCVLTYKHKS